MLFKVESKSGFLISCHKSQIKVAKYIYLYFLQIPPPRFEMPPEESTDLEELEEFSKMFKQRRIKLGRDIFTF